MAGSDAGKVVFARTRQGVVAGVVVDRTPPRLSVLTEAAARETWTEDKVFFTADEIGRAHV